MGTYYKDISLYNRDFQRERIIKTIFYNSFQNTYEVFYVQTKYNKEKCYN